MRLPSEGEGWSPSEGLAALVTWGASLALAVGLLPPGSPWLVPYTSDTAIPLLMARAPSVDLFHAYYLGQDRFGAWPFLAARALGGTDWTAEGLQAALVAGAWVGVLALALRVKPGRPGVGAVLLPVSVLALHPAVRVYALELSQPYGWQLAAVAWAWLGLRAQAGRRTVRAALAWGLLAAVPTALAMWMSTSSLTVLAALAGVEVLRARARGEGLPGAGRLAVAMPLALAMLFERQLRRLYHRFAERHFHHDFRTSLEMDRGHLLDNAREVFSRLLEGPLPLLGGLVLLLVGLGLAWRRWGRSGMAQVPEAVWMAAGCGLAALAQVPVLVVVSHVRINEFASRYFCLVHFFAALGLGALVLAAVEAWSAPRARRLGGWGVAAALVLAAAFRPTPSQEEAGFARARVAAGALATLAPDTVLMGGYWQVYILAALQPPEVDARPLPQEGDYQRTPFLVPALRAASEVVWVQPDEEAHAGPPPARRGDFQVELEREDAPLLRVPGTTFWRYQVVRAR